jgi:hypothetical protein
MKRLKKYFVDNDKKIDFITKQMFSVQLKSFLLIPFSGSMCVTKSSLLFIPMLSIL